jgi:hypothetical protein
VHSPQAGELFERGSFGHGECLAIVLELDDEHANKNESGGQLKF